jgi:hypothetical protein
LQAASTFLQTPLFKIEPKLHCKQFPFASNFAQFGSIHFEQFLSYFFITHFPSIFEYPR